MWERGEDVQGRGAAGMEWRQGCPSLLQHLWNLPGTLWRYNAGSQPSSCEDWGLPEAFQLPTSDTGDGTRDSHHPALRRSRPSPGSKKRWGHGELAKQASRKQGQLGKGSAPGAAPQAQKSRAGSQGVALSSASPSQGFFLVKNKKADKFDAPLGHHVSPSLYLWPG